MLTPFGAPGSRIGLLGGSFNPAHAAHRQISLIALKRLRLDAVWWLVTPGNPLKDERDLEHLPERMRLAREVASHPRIIVSDIEARLGTRYTADTLQALTRRWPATRFVWLMGADNLMQFHRWRHWREIADLIPIAIIDRPGHTLKATAGRAAQTLAHARLPEHLAPVLPLTPAPAWTFLHGPRSSLSSSAIRAGRDAAHKD